MFGKSGSIDEQVGLGAFWGYVVSGIPGMLYQFETIYKLDLNVA